MKNWIRTLALAGLLVAGFAHADVKEGTDYKLLPKTHAIEVPGKLEVIEFFWYGCPHCRSIEPAVDAWAKKLPKDVNFRRVHVIWPGRPDIEAHAKIFVALQAMGIDGKYQPAVMDAVQGERLELRRDNVLYPWLKKQGIDEAKFRASYNSFSSNLALKKLTQLSQEYAVEGVPAFFVNGKYAAGPSMNPDFTRVIDELLAKERQAGKKK